MNPLLLQQLKKIKAVKLPEYDETTINLVIPKQEVLKITSVEVGHYYLLELADYLLHPSDSFTLHQNWNNNIIPKDHYMKAEVSQILGKMIKIQGVGYDYATSTDLDTVWEGWVPLKSVNILEELI